MEMKRRFQSPAFNLILSKEFNQVLCFVNSYTNALILISVTTKLISTVLEKNFPTQYLEIYYSLLNVKEVPLW